MSHPRERSNGQPDGALPGDGAGRHGASGGAAEGERRSDADCHVVMLNAKPTEPSDSRALEKRARIFGGPIVATSPVEMAEIEQVDSFRELRTRLTFMAAGVGLAHFTTVVVSVTEGGGASFVARNLAAAFTMQDRIAVLIDCNFRNPTQQKALGPEGDVDGLADFLDCAPGAHVERLIAPTAIPGLYLIPAGHCAAGPKAPRREYFSSPTMRALIGRLREESCDVFLDGPPVRGAPDARILSDLADFVVLVVGYGRATHQAVAQAAALFDPNKFAGVVFNEYLGGPSPARRVKR